MHSISEMAQSPPNNTKNMIFLIITEFSVCKKKARTLQIENHDFFFRTLRSGITGGDLSIVVSSSSVVFLFLFLLFLLFFFFPFLLLLLPFPLLLVVAGAAAAAAGAAAAVAVVAYAVVAEAVAAVAVLVVVVDHHSVGAGAAATHGFKFPAFTRHFLTRANVFFPDLASADGCSICDNLGM